MAYVHKVVITGAKANLKSLLAYLDYFKFDKNERLAYEALFKTNDNEYNHFCFDVNKRSMTIIKEDCRVNTVVNCRETAPSDMKALACSVISELHSPGKAMAVFNLIYKVLAKSKVNPDDLTVVLKRASNGKKVVVSVIDYLDSLTTPGRPKMRLFHKYISSKVYLPRCLIGNKVYLQK